MKRHKANRLVSDVAYNDYLVLICYDDAEWTRRRVPAEKKNDPDFFLRNHQHFATNCCKYRDKVNRNYTKFCKATTTQPDGHLDSYLYNPLCFLSFGHADNLSIVMLDDFDPVHFLTVEARTGLEEVSIAFCPKAKTFRPSGADSICDLHTLLGTNPMMPMKSKGRDHIYSPAHHSFQDTTPLLVFTRLKLVGLATLGHSLLFQHSVFAAMSKKIKSTLQILKRNSTTPQTHAALIQENVKRNDISSLKCVFLDLQGPEELGTLMFCQNYSVAMGLIMALRTLTFGDVFDADRTGALRGLLGSSESHYSAIRLCQKSRGDRVDGNIDAIRELHVFRWSHSSLAVSPGAFFDRHHPNCNGHVEAQIGFRISPGHRTNAERRIGKILQQHYRKTDSVDLQTTAYHRCQVGVEDIIVSSAEAKRTNTFGVMPLASLLSASSAILKTFGTLTGKKDSGRDVVDVVTNFLLPVPKIVGQNVDGHPKDLICGEVDQERHFAPLTILLPRLQQRLFYASRPSGNAVGRGGGAAGKLDVTSLRLEMPKLGIPIALRRTIEDLYQDFATVLADPFLFDAVIDMYDTFATLHGVLTKDLPRQMSNGSNCKSTPPSRIDEGRIEQLAQFIHAVDNAFTHRVTKIYPESSFREMSIDFRGGLNQFLLAADAPVKCGLGLFRKFAFQADEEAGYGVVGGLTSVGFVPGAICHSLRLKIVDRWLAYFEVDIPHIIHVDSYCENLHEAFHLSFEALRLEWLKKCRTGEPHVFSAEDPIMAERLSEIFASLLTQMFIFGTDVDAFAFSLLCNYTKSLASAGFDDFDTVVRLTELLIRLFVVTDAIPTGQSDDPFTWEADWIRKNDTVARTVARFRRMVRKVGPFYSEFDRLCKCKQGEAITSYMSRQFEAVYSRLRYYMPSLWTEALGLYGRFAKRECSQSAFDRAELKRNVKYALLSGKPVLRGLSQDYGHRVMTCRAKSSADSLSPLVLICTMLREYISVIKKARDRKGHKEIHLHRDRNTREVKYSEQLRWYNFQIDRDSAAMFCPVPSARKARLRKQIIVLKTFWDISSSLRERRLSRMISDCGLNSV